MALSDLHDDLLRRILYFTPAKESASTSVLARRWRSLWLSSGAVNLESFSYSSGGHDEADAVRDTFLRCAEAALAASHAPISKLTFHVEGQTKGRTFIYDVIHAVLSNPAARCVEELFVAVSHVPQLWVPKLSIGSLPFESLRVLDISTCHCPSLSADLAFPRLEAIRLHRCGMPAKDLQAIIDAAPLLTTLHLDEAQLLGPWRSPIRCPRVSTLVVLADLYWRERSWRDTMDFDAPMLRDFRYRGFTRPFLLVPPRTQITKVDLHFVHDNEHRQAHDERCRLFWQFMNNFNNAKVMKLRLVHLEHIIMVADKTKTAQLLGDTVFSNLQRLDLQAFYTPGRRAGGVAFATFLHCCPMIRVLAFQLSTVDGDPSKSTSHVQELFDEKGKLDLCKSRTMALSDLHDDLLRRILHFTPAKEGASTSALAQRWRSLWATSGAVNLYFFSYASANQCFAFFHGAEAALAAGRGPIRRLNFHLEGTERRVRKSVPIYPVLHTVLSSPAARHVEELRVTVSQPAELVLPRLEAMRLHQCDMRAKDLQTMINAAPLLTILQLHEVQLGGSCKRIRCPRVTSLVLADLDWRESSSWRGGMELHAPMLQSFRYRGFLRYFSLEPPAKEMLANVDLHFVGDNEHRRGDGGTMKGAGSSGSL
ncbi:unnamed protein product [Alopecurus aequalis]